MVNESRSSSLAGSWLGDVEREDDASSRQLYTLGL